MMKLLPSFQCATEREENMCLARGSAMNIIRLYIVPIRVPLGVVRNVVPPVHRKQLVTYWN